jgi:hypothetical protein
MTGFRPLNSKEGDVGATGIRRFLSRRTMLPGETTVELHSESAEACISDKKRQQTGLVNSRRCGVVGREDGHWPLGTHQIREQWSRSVRRCRGTSRPPPRFRPRSCQDNLGLKPGGRDLHEEIGPRIASWRVRPRRYSVGSGVIRR